MHTLDQTIKVQLSLRVFHLLSLVRFFLKLNDSTLILESKLLLALNRGFLRTSGEVDDVWSELSESIMSNGAVQVFHLAADLGDDLRSCLILFFLRM